MGDIRYIFYSQHAYKQAQASDALHHSIKPQYLNQHESQTDHELFHQSANVEDFPAMTQQHINIRDILKGKINKYHRLRGSLFAGNQRTT